VGCKAKLLDVIECDAGNIAAKELKSWIFMGNNRAELAFVLDHDHRSMDFYLTRKGDKLEKLVGRVKKAEESKGTDRNAKRQFCAKVH
jgi:hypothetical protein